MTGGRRRQKIQKRTFQKSAKILLPKATNLWKTAMSLERPRARTDASSTLCADPRPTPGGPSTPDPAPLTPCAPCEPFRSFVPAPCGRAAPCGSGGDTHVSTRGHGCRLKSGGWVTSTRSILPVITRNYFPNTLEFLLITNLEFNFWGCRIDLGVASSFESETVHTRVSWIYSSSES